MLGSNIDQIIALRSASKLPQALRSPVYLTCFGPLIFRNCSKISIYFNIRIFLHSQTIVLQFNSSPLLYSFSSNNFPTYLSFFSLFLLLSFKLFLFPFFFILSFFLSSIVLYPPFLSLTFLCHSFYAFHLFRELRQLQSSR